MSISPTTLVRNKQRNRIDFVLCLLAITILQDLFAQGVVETAQAPLLISPSFVGSDTSARLVSAFQKSHYSYSYEGQSSYTQNDALFASFDKMNTTKNNAWGIYVHYRQTDARKEREPFEDYRRTSYVSRYDQNELLAQLRSTQFEMGYAFMPKAYARLPLERKRIVLPAVQVSYSYAATRESHFLNRAYSVDTTTIYHTAGYTSYNATDSERYHANSAIGHKDIDLHRVGLVGSLMHTAPRGFISYQFGFNIDLVSMDNSNFSLSQSHKKTFVEEERHQEANNYQKLYGQIEQKLAVGIYVPKRTNSLIQISGIGTVSYVFSSVHSSYRPLIINQDYYYVNSKWYDYNNIFGFMGRRYSLNIKFWKILAGVYAGIDSYIEPYGSYYIGYKGKKFILTMGGYASSAREALNATLRLLLGSKK